MKMISQKRDQSLLRGTVAHPEIVTPWQVGVFFQNPHPLFLARL